MSIYSQLRRWVDSALATKGAKHSGFYTTLCKLRDQLRMHLNEFSQLPVNVARNAIRDHMFYDRELAMAAFWFLIAAPNEFEPPKDSELKNWTLPHVNLEFDHGGRMTKMAGGVILVEGGETKGTANGTPQYIVTRLTIVAINEAQKQLERRFRLVDGVLSFGFNLTGNYIGYIFVPYVLQSQRDAILTNGEPQLDVYRQVPSPTTRGPPISKLPTQVTTLRYRLCNETINL